MSQEQGPPMVTGWTAPGMTEEATEMAFELEGGAKCTLLIPHYKLEQLVGALTALKDAAMNAGYLD